jgi:hypothetical protein
MMKGGWLLLLFALCMALASAEERPKAAPPDMEKLLSLYRAFGLSLPPEDAPLARIPTGWFGMANGREERLFTLGFLLKPAGADSPAEVLAGPTRKVIDVEDGKVVEIVGSEKVDVSGLRLESETTFPFNVGPTLAVQCYARGYRSLAERLLARSLDAAEHVGPSVVSTGGPWMSHRRPPTQIEGGADSAGLSLAITAWSHWLNELMKPESDWAHIHGEMQKITTTFPELNAGLREKIMVSLAAAVKPRQAPVGDIEVAIDELARSSDEAHAPAHVGRRIAAYEKILLFGFEAVPALIEHLEDDRLTRSIMVGFNNFPSMPRTVGELAGDLLSDLMGMPGRDDWLPRQLGHTLEKEKARQWWSEAQKMGEEAYLRAHVLPPGRDAINPHLPHLRIIAHRYARHLPEIYRELLERRPTMESAQVAEALGESTLGREEKLRLFLDAAQSDNLGLRHPALRHLRKLDPAAADTILLSLVQKLPRKTRKPVWTSPESVVVHLVMESRSPTVWSAFAAAMKRAHISLRLEWMKPLAYSYAEDHQLAERLDLLAQFLDDPTERVIREDDKLYDGPCAAFEMKRITARDFAASQIASLLKLEEAPKEEWSAKRWAALRQKVKDALKKRAP